MVRVSMALSLSLPLVVVVDQFSLAKNLTSVGSEQASAFIEAGLLLQANGNLPGALIALNQAIQANPNDAEAYTAKGVVLQKQGQSTEAIATFNQAIKINPQLIAPYLGLGQVLVQQGKTAEAKALIERTKTAFQAEGHTQKVEVMSHLLPGF